MDNLTIIAIVSMITSGATIVLGTILPAIGETKVISKGLEAIAQQPDESSDISRNMFVGIAMIESLAIYCLVISVALLFVNPFWNFFTTHLAGK